MRVPEVCPVCVQSDLLLSAILNPSRRIKLQLRNDSRILRAVGTRNRYRAEPTDFLGSIPVELDGTSRGEVGGEQPSEGFKDGDRARAVVVCTGGAQLWIGVVRTEIIVM